VKEDSLKQILIGQRTRNSDWSTGIQWKLEAGLPKNFKGPLTYKEEFKDFVRVQRRMCPAPTRPWTATFLAEI
jgi:hypothetical protein